MSERIQALAQLVFGKSSLKECDLQEIRSVVNRFPFFAPAQFLLLEKLKEEDAPAYEKQLQKAVLYYHNPLSFEFFIASGKFETEFKEEEIMPEENIPESKSQFSNQPIVVFEKLELDPIDEQLSVPVGNLVSEEDNYKEPKETIAMEKLPAESTSPEHTFTFEPFHTVDYFASQGIKLSQEELPKDKLGKQLKSFTEWLKTMKKLPSAEVPSSIDANSESKVLHMAEDSVHDTDIITEAMAEVWLKQGNTGKALEVYNKLCLHNPSKKAYFAAKIDNLKRS